MLTALNLYFCVQRLLHLIQEQILVYPHLFNEFQDQAVFLMQQGIQQMLLLDLLVTEFIGNLFQIVHCLQ